MFYGHATTITKDGKILVSPDRLETIGIADSSRCWGAVLPSANPDKLSHLIISPIAPSLWSLTFRLQLKISDVPGALAKAAGAVSELGVMVYSSECAPSGHSHATWNAVVSIEYDAPEGRGEEIRGPLLKAKRKVESALGEMGPDETRYTSKRLLRLTDDLARSAYRYCDELCREILELNKREENDGGGFLHKRFLVSEEYRFYKPENWEGDDELLCAASHSAGAHSVTCTWNEHLAVHWAFKRTGRSDKGRRIGDERIEFCYERKARALVPTNSSHWVGLIEAGGIELPARGIATIHYRESYIRLVASRHMVSVSGVDREPDTEALRIRIPYEAESATEEPEACGILSEIAKVVAGEGFDIAKMSNSLVSVDPEVETGLIDLVVSENWHGAPPANRAEVRAGRNSRLEEGLRLVGESRCLSSKVTVRKHTPLKLFISSRSDWAKTNPKVFSIVFDVARNFGFEPVYYLGLDGESEERDEENVLLATAKKRIWECQAMLQIVPAEIVETHREPRAGTSSPMTWMIMELAFSEGRGMPYRILIDEKGGAVSRDEWMKLYSPFAGQEIRSFDSSVDVNSGLGHMEEAEQKTADRIRVAVEAEMRALTASLS